ncbi:AAA family ATPase [Acuticoccus sp.]|uniref:AAA family ATPase n=1 Tax=Acuticoccus sp. TaxID=1904378 RepID=UPI003B524A6B
MDFDIVTSVLEFLSKTAGEQRAVPLLMSLVLGLVFALRYTVQTAKENKHLQAELKVSQGYAEGLQAQHKLAGQAVNERQRQLEEYQHKASQLRDDLTAANAAARSYSEQLARYEHDHHYLKAKLDNFDRLVDRHKEQAAELEAKIEESDALARNQRFQLSGAKTDLEHANRRIAELTAELQADGADVRRRLEQLREENAGLRELDEAREALERELRRERRARADLDAKVGEADPDRTAALETEVATLRRELTSQRPGDALDDVLAGLSGEGHESDVWTRMPIKRPANYAERLMASKPIMMIGNLKGGVGKTTLAANLAAHYHERGERVLLIDLDYQGSLSAMTIDEDRKQASPQVKNLFLGREVRPFTLKGRASSAVIDCYYEFADLETILLLEWLANRHSTDVRFRLAQYLLQPAIQERYDRIILDTAPRVSLAFVNAFCAATHLVIPTRLDVLSAETVESFLRKKSELMALRCRPAAPTRMRSDSCYLQYQVVGTMKRYDTPTLSGGEREAIERVQDALKRDEASPDHFVTDAYVPTRASFSKEAGFDIAYFKDPEARLIIDRLAERLEAFAPSRWRLAA